MDNTTVVFEVLTVLLKEIQAFLDVMSLRLVNSYQMIITAQYRQLQERCGHYASTKLQ
jgi:hypothetical protein